MMQSGTMMTAALARIVFDLLNHEAESINGGVTPQQITTPFSNTTQADWAEAVRLWNSEGRHLLAGLPARHCPACAASDSRHIFDSYDGYPYVECLHCGCWFVPRIVDAPLFERFFELCPQARELSDRSFAKRQSEENFQSDLARFNGYFDTLLPLFAESETKRYLDIGCGLGYSLKAAQNRGIDAVGIESNRQCISIGRQTKLDIRHVTESMPREKFHLVAFWESLEHMPNPEGVLTHCREQLEEDGVLAFTVPNQHSPLVRVLRADCNFITGGFDTPGHVNLFSPANLEILLARCGFSLLYLDGQYGLNLGELVSYTQGKTRGALDMLNGLPIDGKLDTFTEKILRTIGSAVSLLERATLTSPILFGFACRTECVGRFAKKAQEAQAKRNANLLLQASALGAESGAPEYLQSEINKRDQMLVESQKRLIDVHDHLQAEVNKRDQMLAELQRQLNKGSQC